MTGFLKPRTPEQVIASERVNIEFEATAKARKLATSDYTNGIRREGEGLKQSLRQAGTEVLTSRFGSLTRAEEKQLFTSIFGQKFYAEYKGRWERMQAQEEAAWNAQQAIS